MQCLEHIQSEFVKSLDITPHIQLVKDVKNTVARQPGPQTLSHITVYNVYVWMALL